VDVDPAVKTGLTQLGIDVDKEIQEGIEQGLSDATDTELKNERTN
jgi:hypothetical protein